MSRLTSEKVHVIENDHDAINAAYCAEHAGGDSHISAAVQAAGGTISNQLDKRKI